jgi:hypothetical protein
LSGQEGEVEGRFLTFIHSFKTQNDASIIKKNSSETAENSKIISIGTRANKLP